MRVVHKKRGTVYETVGEADVQCGRPIAEGDRVMVYRDAYSGHLYVRPVAEFNDGRFVEVNGEKPDTSNRHCMHGYEPW